MAFDIERFTLVGPDGNNKAGRIWKYLTEDATTVVDTVNYFDDVADLVGVGDLIQTTRITDLTADPWVINGAFFVVVNSNVGGVVDTTNWSPIDFSDIR